MKTTFTSGPWRQDNAEPRVVYSEKSIHCIADCAQGAQGNIEQIANARLIAAAPTMYEYLEYCMDVFLDACDCGNCGPCLKANEITEFLNQFKDDKTR